MPPGRSTPLLFALCALAWVAIVARGYFDVKDVDALQPTLPQSEVQRFAREQLDTLQERSFASDRELCGIIYETSDGKLGASRSNDGDEASCDLRYFDEPGMVPVASFHTHGGHSRRYDGEVPSVIDLQSDIASGLDGYVSTPGGRFWHIDHEAGVANLVCGPGCVTQDPRYEPCNGDVIARSYSLQMLESRFAGGGIRC
ncbi:MAG: DUF4329 domain-containing protein [Erythrobacter sp.]